MGSAPKGSRGGGGGKCWHFGNAWHGLSERRVFPFSTRRATDFGRGLCFNTTDPTQHPYLHGSLQDFPLQDHYFWPTTTTMDVPMRDARRGGRKGASNARASRRSDPYARDTRTRPNAPAAQRDAALEAPTPSTVQTGMSYPPPELSIRGSSGPTWIIVSNLVVGTSTEDVRLTFSSFGRVEEVKQRPAPSANHPTVSFEVACKASKTAEHHTATQSKHLG